jgi:hypothetical protein
MSPISSTKILEWWIWDELEVIDPDGKYQEYRIFHWGNYSDASWNLGEVKNRVPLGAWSSLEVQA